MLTHRIAVAALGVTDTARPVPGSRRQNARPFGPLPRALVAAYGIALAGSGAMLSRQADGFDVWRYVGIGVALLGAFCAVLAVLRGRPGGSRRPGPEEAPVLDDLARLAARFDDEVADLQRLLDELPAPPRLSSTGPTAVLLQFPRSVVVYSPGSSETDPELDLTA